MTELWRQVGSVIEWLWSPGPVIAVQSSFGPSWRWFFEAASYLGTVYVVVVVASLVLWLDGRRLAYGLLGGIILATAVDALLWTLIGVPRPDAPEIVQRAHLGVSSFPSGHTVTATLLWGTLAASGRTPWLVPALIVPAVMLSRLYLGAHYVGDVLGGVLIGALLTVTYVRLWPVVEHRLSRLPFAFFLILGICAPFGVLLFVGISPRGWELFAIAAAAGIGLLLEHQYVRYTPTGVHLRQRASKAAIGLGGIGALLLARVLLDGRPVMGAALMALAVLWGVLLAPALFARTKPSQSPAASETSHLRVRNTHRRQDHLLGSQRDTVCRYGGALEGKGVVDYKAIIRKASRSLWLVVTLELIAGLSVSLGALWAFVELSDEVFEGETERLDAALLLWIHSAFPAWLDSPVRLITALGYPWMVVPLLVVAAFIFYRASLKVSSALLVVSVAGGAMLGTGLKSFYERARPELLETGYTTSFYSFPSGHAVTAVSFYGVLTLLIASRLEGWRRWTVAAAGVALVVLIGLSRLYLGVHYPSDVLAGYLAATLWVGTVSTALFLRRSLRASRRRVPR